jgi:hypothetical protein
MEKNGVKKQAKDISLPRTITSDFKIRSGSFSTDTLREE